MPEKEAEVLKHCQGAKYCQILCFSRSFSIEVYLESGQMGQTGNVQRKVKGQGLDCRVGSSFFPGSEVVLNAMSLAVSLVL